MRIIVLCIAVLGAALPLVFGAAGTAEGADYLGELCWLVSPDTGVAPSILKLGVTYLGGRHLLVSGKLIAGPVQVPVYGNIVAFEGLDGTLISSGFNTVFSANQVAFFYLGVGPIDAGTLNGAYRGLSHFFTYSGGTTSYTEDKGILTFISCPPAS
jgi:hypothetical protein